MKAAEISRLLPSVFQQALAPQNPLAALLDVMETLHAPCEAKLARLDETFDPRRTPDVFVPFLARWVGVEWLLGARPRGGRSQAASHLPLDLGRLRELVASAASLARWRGTAKGLLLFLRIATGIDDFHIEENVDQSGAPRPFHIRVHAPAAAQPLRSTIERIVSFEKPAFVTHELVFGVQNGGGV